MPQMKLDNDYCYYMVNFSEDGVEMDDAPDAKYTVMLSSRLKEMIASTINPVSDVFIVSHGYKTDKQGAVGSYAKWMNAMVTRRKEEAAFDGTKVMIVGIHWPSFFTDGTEYQLDDEDRALSLTQDIFASFDWSQEHAVVRETGARVMCAEHVSDQVKEDILWLLRWADDTKRIPLFHTDSSAASDGLRPAAELGERLQVMEGLHEGIAVDMNANPGFVEYSADVEQAERDERLAKLSTQDLLALAEQQFGDYLYTKQQMPQPQSNLGASLVILSVGGFFNSMGNGLKRLGGAVLRHTTGWAEKKVFGTYEDRAKKVGATGVHDLLAALQDAASARAGPAGAPKVRFHGVGHSLGCHVLAGAVCGPLEGPCRLRQRMHSLTLIEPAVACTELQPGQLYNKLVTTPGRDGHGAPRSLIAGTLVVTTSDGDSALKGYHLYHGQPMGLKGAVLSPPADEVCMLPTSEVYGLAPGSITNVNSSKYICTPKDSNRIERNMIGSHCNIYGPEVCHLVWAAASVPLPAGTEALCSGAHPAAAAPAEAKA